MNFFVKHLKATRSGILIMLAMQSFLFLLGFLIVLGINAFINKDRDYAAIGSMMALMGSVFAGLLRGSGGMNRYRTAVSMGRTRRSYLLADPAITALICALGLGFAWLLDRFEVWVYSLLYPGWNLDFDIISLMKWWYYLLFIAGTCILDFCLGALQLRFGAKGFAIVWFPLCFSSIILNSTVGAAQEGSTSLLAQIGRGILFIAGLLSPAIWAVVGIVILLVLVVLSAVCYSRAEIRM